MKFSAFIAIAGLSLTNFVPSVRGQLLDAYEPNAYTQDNFGVPDDQDFFDTNMPTNDFNGLVDEVKVDVDLPVGYADQVVTFKQEDYINNEEEYLNNGEEGLKVGALYDIGEELFSNGEDNFVGEEALTFGEENLGQAVDNQASNVEVNWANGEDDNTLLNKYKNLLLVEEGEIGLPVQYGEEQIFEKLVGEDGEEGVGLYEVPAEDNIEDYGLGDDSNQEEVLKVEFDANTMEGPNGSKVTNGKGFKRADHLSNVFDRWNDVAGNGNSFLPQYNKLGFGLDN